MERSRGFRNKTRKKLTKDVRTRGILPVSKVIKNFNVGDRVHIILEPSMHKGMPHPRFHGKTGTIVEKRGKAYTVEIFDGDARKLLISAPVHLQKQER